MADKCYVKIYDEPAPDQPDSAMPGRRTDRCYRIYPMIYDPNFHELDPEGTFLNDHLSELFE